jgi:hypothetical protein
VTTTVKHFQRLEALTTLRDAGLAESGEGPSARATAAARGAVRLLSW